jgi:Poxvirus Late Transcription Factor VLTF3 like
MPLFKPKHEKKIIIPTNHQFTLDKKHSEFVNEFKYNDEKIIPGLKLEILKMTKSLKGLKPDEKRDCLEKINSLEKQINDLKEKQITYYLDNSKHIFEYFETKKKICDGETSDEKKTTALNCFFKFSDDEVLNSNNLMDEFNRPNLLQNYLSNIDSSFVDLSLYYTKKNICRYCSKGEMIAMEDEGILLCNVCSVISKYLIENEKPSYREPPKEVCFYAYKKINHFKEILAQFQGKESTNIPAEVIQNIKAQIKKERLDIDALTYDELKGLLKKLGYNKYYEHINFIKHKLGIQPVIIPQDIEETLCNFFMEIQHPYAKHCPDYRINFLHYFFVLYKLFQLIGEDKYLKEIPMLKDKDKLMEQENIWKKICQELNWEFIPTV